MLNSPYKALFVLRQFGIIQAFEQLVLGLQRNQLLESAAIIHLPPLISKNFLEQLDPETRFDFVMTGTSSEAQVEEEVWQWAQKEGIPCFAFHDQWVNTAVRFQGASTLPTDILVVDDAAKQLVLELNLGIPITIIGSPVWDTLGDLVNARIAVDSHLVAFATEPAIISSYKAEHGFDDLDCLGMAIEALENKASEKPWKLMILVHPSDRRERVEKFLENHTHSPNVEIQISRTPAYKILETVQYLLGMRSMLLVNASLAGIPVVSFQPHRTTSSPATDREGIEVVTALEQAPLAFQQALKNRPHLPKILSSDLFQNFLKARLKHL